MKKLALFTFVDAFGWEVYKRYGFLPDQIQDARKLKTTFGFSSAADPSILTGRYPDEHTHWSCFFYSPGTSPFKIMKLFSILPGFLFDRWRVRHWMSKIIARLYRFTGYFEMYSVPFAYLPYFDYLEKRDYFVPGGILRTDTIFDYCHSREIPYFCSNWRLPEEKNLAIMSEVIEQGEIAFAYLYLPKLDGVMHAHGTEHPAVESKIRWLEQEVSRVIEKARGVYDDVAFYLFSDHGMANVSGGVDLISVVKKTGLVYGKDYIAMYDSTMARFWFLKPRARELITRLLATVPRGTVVSDDELRSMHTYFEDRKFGELFFLMDPGVMINPSFMGLNVIPGMHGYHPDDKDSDAILLANRSIPGSPGSITHIREIMEREIADG